MLWKLLQPPKTRDWKTLLSQFILRISFHPFRSAHEAVQIDSCALFSRNVEHWRTKGKFMIQRETKNMEHNAISPACKTSPIFWRCKIRGLFSALPAAALFTTDGRGWINYRHTPSFPPPTFERWPPVSFWRLPPRVSGYFYCPISLGAVFRRDN